MGIYYHILRITSYLIVKNLFPVILKIRQVFTNLKMKSFTMTFIMIPYFRLIADMILFQNIILPWEGLKNLFLKEPSSSEVINQNISTYGISFKLLTIFS